MLSRRAFPTTLLAAAFVGSVVFAGCSGNPSSPIDGGDGGCIQGPVQCCINPTVGGSCTANDVACQPPGDICCVGYAWMCQNGTWVKAGVGCACQVEAGLRDAGPFACGPQATCNSASQYCVDQAPGLPSADGGILPDSFSCSVLPPACALDPTCACVKANGACSPTAVASCDEAGGQVTVHCMGQ